MFPVLRRAPPRREGCLDTGFTLPDPLIEYEFPGENAFPVNINLEEKTSLSLVFLCTASATSSRF